MKYKKIKLLLISLTILIALALALPEFKFEIKNKSFRYPSIGFSRIGIPQDFGSFRKSKDVFTSTKIRAQIEFEGDSDTPDSSSTSPLSDDEKKAAQDKILNMIQERANYVGLYNIDIYSEYANSGEYYITFVIPKEFTNPSLIATRLSLKGEISFNKSFTENIDINDYDIEDGITISSVIGLTANSGKQYLTQNNLKFDISQSKSTEYQNLFAQTQDQNSGVYMLVDGSPLFSLYSDQTDLNKLTVRAIPLEIGDDEGKLLISIVKSFFTQKESLPYALSIDDASFSPVTPGFNPKGGTYISLAFIFSAALIALLTYYKFKFKGLVISGLLLSLQVLSLVTALKFFNASLSLGLIIGFIVSYFLLVRINFEILEEHYEQTKRLITNLRNTNIITLIILVTFYRLNLNLSSFNDAIGVLMLFTVINIVYSLMHYTFIIQFYHHFYLREK